MFLSIPVSNLLVSQLEIGIDPLSGNFTYNIKDTSSCLQYVDGAESLMLTLQSSPWDGCLRICTSSITQSANTAQVLSAEKPQNSSSTTLDLTPAPPVLVGHSDQNHAFSAEVPVGPNLDDSSQGKLLAVVFS